MANSPAPVSLDVTIMGREFRVACPEEQREGLLKAVSYLDGKMREIRDTGKVIGLERIAIMTALNLAHDLISARPDEANPDTYRDQVRRMSVMLDQALAQQDNLF